MRTSGPRYWGFVFSVLIGVTVVNGGCDGSGTTAGKSSETGAFKAAIVSSGGDDLGAVRIDVSLGGTAVESKTVLLATQAFPGKPPFKGGDALFTLRPGTYAVAAVGLDKAGNESKTCAGAASMAEVKRGETAEIVLTLFCDDAGTGGLDVVVETKHQPVITNLAIDPSKFAQTCDKTLIRVAFANPDGVALKRSLTVTSAPDGAKQKVTAIGEDDTKNVYVFVAQDVGEYQLQFSLANPGDPRQTASLSFPIHVAAGADTSCLTGTPPDSIAEMYTRLDTALGLAGFDAAVAALSASRKAYAASDLCGAARAIDDTTGTPDSLINLLQAARKARPRLAEVAEDLFADSSGLWASLLTRAGKVGTCGFAPGFGKEVEASVLEATDTTFSASLIFGAPTFSSHATNIDDATAKALFGGGRRFTQVHIPGMSEFGTGEGMPAIPTVRHTFAYPVGTKPRLTVAGGRVDRSFNLRLYPVQDQPEDATTAPPTDRPDDPRPDPSTFLARPFKIDRAVYTGEVTLPPGPCHVELLGTWRDLQLGQVVCQGARYNPSSQTLDVYSAAKFQLEFEGKSEGFLPKNANSPFDNGVTVATSVIANASAIAQYPGLSVIRPLFCTGGEFLILTPNVFKPAADALAAWKNSKGIATYVRTIDKASGGYLSNTEIKAQIKSDYDRCLVRPSYVLLLGDANTIAPFYVSSVASDLPYARLTPAIVTGLPDLAVGRIPVMSLTQANTVVNKIINYEKTPPTSVDFYRNMTIAAYFQATDDGATGQTYREKRTFIQVSEQTRNAMMSEGYTVQRIYNRQTGSGLATPSQFVDGTALTADIGAGSGFPWSGNTANISAAFNAGRFLVLHRDHGWPDGWGDPSFATSNASALINGALLPVVYSINCASGQYDDPADMGRFTETLLRNTAGGAVGVIGDTRNSPSWHNSQLTRGFFDATWPSTLGSYGGGGSFRRLGDIMNYGKGYLVSVTGLGDGNTQKELNLYHVFGDPTLELWTENPHRILIPKLVYYLETWPPRPIPLPDPAPLFSLKYDVDGTVITALQYQKDGSVQAVARGVVENGVAKMIAIANVDPSARVELIASGRNTESVLLNPQPLPPRM